MIKKNFHRKYPLSLVEAIRTPCVAYDGWALGFPDLPKPSVRGIKEFILFTGVKDSAFRTAVSREKKKGKLVFFTDKKGIPRYYVSEQEQELSRFYHNDSAGEAGLTLGVFQFNSAQSSQRYRLKEILRSFSFQMLTQNVYVSRRISHKEILRVLADAELGDHLFLFNMDYPEGRTLKKVREVFETEKWQQRLVEYKKDLTGYLSENKEQPEDLYNRFLYAGAATHVHIRLNMPPLGEAVFPEKRVFGEIEKIINSGYIDNAEEMIQVYLKRHGGQQ